MKNMKTVLLVDDDPDIIKQMGAALKKNYKVMTASSGAECMTRIAAQKPDLIVMDVMMTEPCEGLETAKKIKEDGKTKDIPILMLTSVNESFDYRSQTDAQYFPHDTWLDKPVKPERLLREIEKLIDK